MNNDVLTVHHSPTRVGRSLTDRRRDRQRAESVPRP